MKWHFLGILVVGALSAQARTEPDRRPTAAYAANEAGLAAHARGDYAGAERSYEQAIDMWRALGSKFEAHLSITLYNFGLTLCQTGAWLAGAHAFDEGLIVSRRTLGPKHINSVGLLNSLGAADFVRGEIGAAESAYNEALAIERELYPRDVQTWHTLISLAAIRMRQHRAGEAVPFADEALRLTLEADGEKTVESAMAYSCAAQVRRAQGRTELALPLFRKARALWAAVAPDSPGLASVMSQEGLALMDDGKLLQAEKDMRGAIDVLSTCHGCGYELAVAQTNLGILLTHKHKFKEAATELNSALKIEQQITGASDGLSNNTTEAIRVLRATQLRQ